METALRFRGARSGRRAEARRSHGRRRTSVCRASSTNEVWLLDYGAGNVRSIRNAIKHLGYTVRDVESPADLGKIEVNKLVFPGVGAFGSAMGELQRAGYVDALRDYIKVRHASLTKKNDFAGFGHWPGPRKCVWCG